MITTMHNHTTSTHWMANVHTVHMVHAQCTALSLAEHPERNALFFWSNQQSVVYILLANHRDNYRLSKCIVPLGSDRLSKSLFEWQCASDVKTAQGLPVVLGLWWTPQQRLCWHECLSTILMTMLLPLCLPRKRLRHTWDASNLFLRSQWAR